MEKNQVNISENTKNWYDRYYKILFIIPILVLIISLSYLFYFNSQHGDIIYKDSSLAGGTTITLTDSNIDFNSLKEFLQAEFQDINIREIKEISTGKRIALVIDSIAEPGPLQEKVESFTGYKLDSTNSSIEFTGSALSDNFYKQLILAVIISFLLISLVVFFLFRNVIRSAATVLAVFANIVMPLALVDLLGIKLSAAGIAAFLMLIGYSVDADILLTTRVLKRTEGTVNQRMYAAFKTGIFITGVALIGLLPAFFIVTGLPESFRQIFLILAFGLIADIMNTWLMNAAIVKWYAERMKK